MWLIPIRLEVENVIVIVVKGMQMVTKDDSREWVCRCSHTSCKK